MELQFEQPWLVFAAVALLVGSIAVGAWRKRPAPVLFVLAAAAFFAAGARPGIAQPEPEVRHVLVVDVSASMRSRDIAAFVEDVLDTSLPSGHSLVMLELSDALRDVGSVRGDGTDYSRLRELAADQTVNGEILFITDGRGDFDELYGALRPERLMLLTAPSEGRPDAIVSDLQAPAAVPAGATIRVTATLGCDTDAQVPWRLLVDGAEVASGNQRLRAHVPHSFTRTLLPLEAGLRRIALRLDLADDREPANDESAVRVIVGGRRTVEYCVPDDVDPGSDALLQILLADEHNQIHVRHTLPLDSRELQGTGVVIINNLPLEATRDELRRLAEWVENGGNLLMVGTGGAFGPGGYRGTPIESVMPVRFRPDDASPRRTLLLLDISQSMEDVLPGGETKLQRMQAAARRFREALGTDDQAAVVGFQEGLAGDIRFLPPGSDALKLAIDGLGAGGSTHIRSSLAQAVRAVPDGTRILMITDGEEVEGATGDMYRAVGAELIESKVRLDVVLTTVGDKPWIEPLQTGGGELVHTWSVGGEGFDGLIETLERAMAGADQEWVITTETPASGAGQPIPRLVRTSRREDPSVVCPVWVEQPSDYPVVARRTLVGRTAAICTDSWGGEPMIRLWLDPQFRQAVDETMAFLFENASAVKLALNPLEQGAELIWTGVEEAPLSDLQTDAGTARLDGPGRWLLEEFPSGEGIRVFHGDRFLQRIPLPDRVPDELRRTGNDPVFFERAEQAGIRVLSGLGAWNPRRWEQPRVAGTDVTWLPALAAMLLLIGGFATRRR